MIRPGRDRHDPGKELLRRWAAQGDKEDTMFWNDPILYGATLPYKDFPVQTPFVGQQQMLPHMYNMQRFIPPTYGFTPPFFHNYNVPQVPFLRPFEPNQPFFGLNQPFYGLNQPFHGWKYPFTY